MTLPSPLRPWSVTDVPFPFTLFLLSPPPSGFVGDGVGMRTSVNRKSPQVRDRRDKRAQVICRLLARLWCVSVFLLMVLLRDTQSGASCIFCEHDIEVFFSSEWEVSAPSVQNQSMQEDIKLSGARAGAPPTATTRHCTIGVRRVITFTFIRPPLAVLQNVTRNNTQHTSSHSPHTRLRL